MKKILNSTVNPAQLRWKWAQTAIALKFFTYNISGLGGLILIEGQSKEKISP